VNACFTGACHFLAQDVGLDRCNGAAGTEAEVTAADDRRVQDPSHRFAEIAIARMGLARTPVTPRTFEVWFNVARGEPKELVEAVERVFAGKGEVSSTDIDVLYEEYLSNRSFAAHAERTSAGVLVEIDHVMEMIELALGNTTSYGQSLATISDDLAQAVDRNRIRDIVATLVVSTREAAATNKTLESRLRETRNEIGSLREALESVRVEALVDAVTGLANRKHFDEMLVKSIDQAAIQRAPLALIMADIDRFKSFNDNFGHLTGDQVLKLVAVTMRDRVKRKATLARFGGEEFAVILPDTTLETARDIAENVRRAVLGRELIKRSTGETLGRVTLSLGVASLQKGDTAATLLDRADMCMLAAKRGGRNRTIVESDAIDDLAISEVA
jgi:diguanylate cyclase